MTTAQLDIFAPPVEAVTVTPTPDVLYLGARADGVPRHTHIPSKRPKAMQTDEEWLFALRVAEECIRWRSWTRPHPLPLDEKPEEVIGGGADYWYDGKGVCVGGRIDARYAPWSALLRGLREQRESETHIADARDLAHAYHALEQYDHFYVRGGGSVAGGARGDWRERVAVPYLERLRTIVRSLGGASLDTAEMPERAA